MDTQPRHSQWTGATGLQQHTANDRDGGFCLEQLQVPSSPAPTAGSGLGAHVGRRVAGAPSAPTLGLGILLSFPSLWPPLLWPLQLMCPLQSRQLPVTLPRSSEAACHSERWVKERQGLF